MVAVQFTIEAFMIWISVDSWLNRPGLDSVLASNTKDPLDHQYDQRHASQYDSSLTYIIAAWVEDAVVFRNVSNYNERKLLADRKVCGHLLESRWLLRQGCKFYRCFYRCFCRCFPPDCDALIIESCAFTTSACLKLQETKFRP